MRKFLIPLVFIFILLSCSSKESSLALLSPSGSEVYLFNKDKCAEIHISSTAMDYLISRSGEDEEQILKEIFNEDIKITKIDEESASQREELYSLLFSISASESKAEVLAIYAKELKGSEFINTINSLSSNFDEEIYDLVDKDQVINRYELAPTLKGDATWRESVTFLRNWADALLR